MTGKFKFMCTYNMRLIVKEVSLSFHTQRPVQLCVDCCYSSWPQADLVQQFMIKPMLTSGGVANQQGGFLFRLLQGQLRRTHSSYVGWFHSSGSQYLPQPIYLCATRELNLNPLCAWQHSANMVSTQTAPCPTCYTHTDPPTCWYLLHLIFVKLHYIMFYCRKISSFFICL